MNKLQASTLEIIQLAIQDMTKFWPTEWKNEFRNALIEWLQENL